MFKKRVEVDNWGCTSSLSMRVAVLAPTVLGIDTKSRPRGGAPSGSLAMRSPVQSFRDLGVKTEWGASIRVNM